jgi:hypothetical protein
MSTAPREEREPLKILHCLPLLRLLSPFKAFNQTPRYRKSVRRAFVLLESSQSAFKQDLARVVGSNPARESFKSALKC